MKKPGLINGYSLSPCQSSLPPPGQGPWPRLSHLDVLCRVQLCVLWAHYKEPRGCLSVWGGAMFTPTRAGRPVLPPPVGAQVNTPPSNYRHLYIFSRFLLGLLWPGFCLSSRLWEWRW